MTKTLTPQDIRDLLGENPGFFGVTFTKKDGSERRMTAQMGVKKHLAGGPRAYDFDEKGLLPVWDRWAKGAHGPKDRGYRSVNISTLKEIRARGKKWKIQDGQITEVASSAN